MNQEWWDYQFKQHDILCKKGIENVEKWHNFTINL
jgi:3-deoxy-D-arabino-heptulosonate 7-phosphate (DAHP) synthase